MRITPDMARQSIAPLTGRELAYLLRTIEVGINERAVRHMMTGNRTMPLVLYYAALWLQQEHDRLSDKDYNDLLDTVRQEMTQRR